jgi:hypothetical protein
MRALLLVAWIAGWISAGCAPSILVRRDDQTFSRAETRLARGLAAVSTSTATDEEKRIAAQAESLYWYRFDAPRRRASSYLAQAGAVAIEIPALQNVAGALDISDLRLRMTDGAVHLWETLLDRYPRSELRPFVLYRLGWAYRSVGVAGLPRDSDEAFDLLRVDDPRSPLAPLAEEAKAWAWKSKDVATAWSIVPGLGQVYLRQYGSGAVRLLIAAAAATMIVAPVVIAFDKGHDLTWSHDWPLLAVGAGGLVVLSFDYTTAYQDAIRDVVRWNEETERAFEDRHPDAP